MALFPIPTSPTAPLSLPAIGGLALGGLLFWVPDLSVVRGPGGELVAEAGGEFAIQGEGSPDQRDWLQGFMVSVGIGFEATDEGIYTIEHMVDASSASVPMHVRQGPAPT